jgi:hypothetical protein
MIKLPCIEAIEVGYIQHMDRYHCIIASKIYTSKGERRDLDGTTAAELVRIVVIRSIAQRRTAATFSYDVTLALAIAFLEALLLLLLLH